MNGLKDIFANNRPDKLVLIDIEREGRLGGLITPPLVAISEEVTRYAYSGPVIATEIECKWEDGLVQSRIRFESTRKGLSRIGEFDIRDSAHIIAIAKDTNLWTKPKTTFVRPAPRRTPAQDRVLEEVHVARYTYGDVCVDVQRAESHNDRKQIRFILSRNIMASPGEPRFMFRRQDLPHVITTLHRVVADYIHEL